MFVVEVILYKERNLYAQYKVKLNSHTRKQCHREKVKRTEKGYIVIEVDDFVS